MIDGVSVQLRDATESSVRVTLVASGDVDLSGKWELYGPRCEYGRTLASTFRGRATEAGDVEFLVTEPCYWSPAMPFLYELRRTDSLADGETHFFGLRQLIVHGRNLRLGGERVVLRGAFGCYSEEIQQAHSAECALALLAVGAYTMLETAARYGTTLLLEADEFIDLPSLIREASWNPAVAGIVLDSQLLTPAIVSSAAASGIILAQGFNSQNWGDVNSLSNKTSLIVITLMPHERPPGWMASCRRPVIAIRLSCGIFANFQHARIACDNLQAELAPTFDFSGYFVEDPSRPARIN